MKKMLIFAAILIVLFGAIFFINQAEKEDSSSEAENYYTNPISDEELQKQLDSNGDATVYFYQTTCVHCQKVSPVVVPMAEEMGIDMKVMDLQKYEAGWDTFKIDGTPTIIRYKAGKEVSRISGEQEEATFKEWFEANK